MDQKVESLSMEIINPNAAGIDIGSRSHWVSIGQKEKDIREFGVFNEDLKAIVDWLAENKITTVAMESRYSGSKWASNSGLKWATNSGRKWATWRLI